MNALSFFIGLTTGVTLVIIIVFSFIALNRRMTEEQRKANKETLDLLTIANGHRERSADALNHIRWDIDQIKENTRK